MLTIEEFFDAITYNKLASISEVDKACIIHILLKTEKSRYLSSKFKNVLKELEDKLSYDAKRQGVLQAVIETDNIELLTIIDNKILDKLLDYMNSNYVYNNLKGLQEYSPLFYNRGCSQLLLLQDLENIEHIIKECNFVYTYQLDAFLPAESIKKIGHCLSMYNKRINFVGVNYLGLVEPEIVIKTITDDAVFHYHTHYINKDVNVENIMNLKRLFKKNSSPYFEAKLKSIKDNTPCDIVTSEEALSGGVSGVKMIDFNNESDLIGFKKLIGLYGKSIVNNFTNFKTQDAVSYNSLYDKKLYFFLNWKPNDICPKFYKENYGIEIGWKSSCGDKENCDYCGTPKRKNPSYDKCHHYDMDKHP